MPLVAIFAVASLAGCASGSDEAANGSAAVTAGTPAPGAPASSAGTPASAAPATPGAPGGTKEIDVSWDFATAASTDDFPRTDLGAAFAGADAGRLVPKDGVAFGTCSDLDPSTWKGSDKPALVAQCGSAGDFSLYGIAKQGTQLVLLKVELEENGPDGAVATVASEDVGVDFKLVPQKFLTLSWTLDKQGTDDQLQTHVTLDVRGVVAGQIDFGTVFGACSDLLPSETQFKTAPATNVQCGFAGDFRELGAFKENGELVGRILPLEENAPNGDVVTSGQLDVPADAVPRVLGE